MTDDVKHFYYEILTKLTTDPRIKSAQDVVDLMNAFIEPNPYTWEQFLTDFPRYPGKNPTPELSYSVKNSDGSQTVYNVKVPTLEDIEAERVERQKTDELWRKAREQKEKKREKQRRFDEFVKSDEYKAFFEKWDALLKDSDGRTESKD